eukprot:TRINITY_DN93936_c0_g1_i1.p2 TRINITY_DN93936_c0_g1~~TRINITY_DN93936_c0_g1_i1.p2  ORF type:complete len:102 (+),score=9.32 TRINITY_DN93936_c0_g1_i1:142-447(+)
MSKSVREAIILAGGVDTRLSPLTDPEHPKCLLPVANSPILLSPLLAAKRAGITNVFVVACGDVVSSRVQKWIQKETQLQGLSIQVITVNSESGSAECIAEV